MSDTINIDLPRDLAEAALILLDRTRHDSDIDAHQLELSRQALVEALEAALQEGDDDDANTNSPDDDADDDGAQAASPVGDEGSAGDAGDIDEEVSQDAD